MQPPWKRSLYPKALVRFAHAHVYICWGCSTTVQCHQKMVNTHISQRIGEKHHTVRLSSSTDSQSTYATLHTCKLEVDLDTVDR